MSRPAQGQPRLKRLRAIRRKMSFAAFQRLPRRVGWKHEYFGGRAYIRPSPVMVTFRLELGPRGAIRWPGLRRLRAGDAAALRDPFLAAFATAPEYACRTDGQFREAAVEYLGGFFGAVRGDLSPASVVAEADGEIVGAALVKRQPRGPLLDCIFVRPEVGRGGLATAMATRVVRSLRKRGESRLTSYAMLANEPSLAWHARFGFREVPDLFVASQRWRCYEYEVERHRELNDLSEQALAPLIEAARHWAEESRRLHELERRAIQ
jgi:RimJ/RimL family protein N-acetyltransferase